MDLTVHTTQVESDTDDDERFLLPHPPHRAADAREHEVSGVREVPAGRANLPPRELDMATDDSSEECELAQVDVGSVGVLMEGSASLPFQSGIGFRHCRAWNPTTESFEGIDHRSQKIVIDLGPASRGTAHGGTSTSSVEPHPERHEPHPGWRDLARRIGVVQPGDPVPSAIRQQRWSPLNMPLMWAAAQDEAQHPVLIGLRVPQDVCKNRWSVMEARPQLRWQSERDGTF